jgi:molecular chaperone DnaK
MSEKIIGIDLGTTNSVVAIIEDGKPTVIINEEGERTTPSIVAFKDGERLVGKSAKNQAITNPINTIYSIKRFMGRRFTECGKEPSQVPYKVVNKNDAPRIDIDGKFYAPPEISAMVLQKLKRAAEAYLGHEVSKAVITVPAYFNDAQRQSTKDAGQIAGLEVMRIINEPTAAALAYGFNQKEEQKIAVYDFGGGTFDISVLEVDEGFVEVKSTNGDTHLGGDDVDQVLIEWILKEFNTEHSLDLFSLPGSEMAQQRIRQTAEQVKKDLSSAPTASISLPFLYADATGPKNLDRTLSRPEFERMIEPVINRTLEPCRLALKDAGMDPSEIDEVILVGGSTRIPLVREKVTNFFGKKPNQSVNPDEVVALGASIQGGILAKDESVGDMLLLDVTPLSLGLETMGGICTVQIARNTTVPTKKSEVFSTAADNQTAVDIMVYQGERKFAKDNRLLGQFRLDGIDPAQRGMPQVEVTFDIDANGILTVTAKDKKTGKSQDITIEDASGLSSEEVERMQEDAKANASADEERFTLVEATNKLDSEIHQIEKFFNENKENLPAEMSTQFEAILSDAREAKDSEDLERMKGASEQLNQMMQNIQQASQAAGAAGGQGAGPATGSAEPVNSAGGDDDIIDITPE